MLRLQDIRENKEDFIKRLKIRNKDFSEEINKVILLDENRRAVQVRLDEVLSKSNRLAKEIGTLYAQGKGEQANELKKESSELKEQSKALSEELASTDRSLTHLLYEIPNVPNPIVPEGKSDSDNEIIFESGAKPNLDKAALPHWEITEKYNIIDFDLGAKITGAGFPVYKGKGARLQRALINFFLDMAHKEGYQEVIPPLMVNEASGYGTGQLPDKEGQMYHAAADDLYLIPTAEVPITNMYRDIIVKKEDLPFKNVGYTPCFRREAGSYGKDVRGLNRLHQFDKVEIVQIVHPSNSYQVLDNMVEHVKILLEKLELPYRVAKLCGGDLGFTSALTYDMEVYSAAQEKWLEVSSVSNFETYQANRLKVRFKEEKDMVLAHTLNGSALALPRIVAALLENNQTDKGIRIPKCLVPYTGFEYLN